MDPKKLVGYWSMKSIRTRVEDGTWMDEKVWGGGASFTESQKICTFVQTSEGPYGYAGDYHVEGAQMSIRISAGIVPELVNAVLKREIKFISEGELNFSGNDLHTGRYFEIIFTREA